MVLGKEDTMGVVGASRHDIDVEVAAELPGHAATLGVTPVVVGLAIGLQVTNIDPQQIEDTNSNNGKMEKDH